MVSALIGSSDCHVTSGSGHVIPEDHLLPLSLSRGPSGVTFDFTYQTRDSSALVRDKEGSNFYYCESQHVYPYTMFVAYRQYCVIICGLQYT